MNDQTHNTLKDMFDLAVRVAKDMIAMDGDVLSVSATHSRSEIACHVTVEAFFYAFDKIRRYGDVFGVSVRRDLKALYPYEVFFKYEGMRIFCIGAYADFERLMQERGMASLLTRAPIEIIEVKE